MTTPNNGGAAAGGGLAEVLALLAKATPGEWDAKADENEHGGWKPSTQEVSIYSGAKLIAHYETSFAEYPEDAENEANAEAIAAAVNYLRSHGPAVAELIAADKEYDEAIATHGIASRWAIEATERRRAALLPFQTGGAE